jgi:hypothetical protein
MTDYYKKYLKYKTKYLNLKNGYQLGGAYNYSNIYVFNKLNQIIEEISYDKYDKKIHIIMDDKQLIKLSKMNDKKIKNTIQSQPKYKSKFFHVSTKEFPYPIQDKNKDKSSWLGKGIYKNPRGIWFSCGVSWQKYIGNKPNQWSLATYVYELEPSDTVLKISSIDELKKFINEFKKDNIKIIDIINWNRVKKEYDGLIICPYLGDIIWGKNANNFSIYGNNKQINEYINKVVGNKWKNNIYFTAEWYRHWEEGTGIIWKPSTGLINIRLLKKLNTYESLF